MRQGREQTKTKTKGGRTVNDTGTGMLQAPRLHQRRGGVVGDVVFSLGAEVGAGCGCRVAASPLHTVVVFATLAAATVTTPYCSVDEARAGAGTPARLAVSMEPAGKVTVVDTTTLPA
eukprot:gene1412-15896_t